MSTNRNTKGSDHHSKKRKQTKSSRVIHVSVYNAHRIQENSMNLTTSHLQSMDPTTISMKKSSVSKKLRANVSKPTSSASVAPLNDQHSHLSSQSDMKKWKNNGINEDSKETLTKCQMKDRSLDKISCIYDHHRKKKKRRNVRQCFRLGILLLIITSIIISVVLPILLIKKLSKTSVATAAVLRWNSSGITVASSLVGPYGFKVDRFDTLYIAEYYAHRIRRWLSGASNGTIIAGSVNGTNGSASNQFSNPVDVLVEDNGDMYVTDRGNGRLQFRANGSSSGITVAGTGSNNSIPLSRPSGIVQDSSSAEIYIADSGYNAVVNYPSGSVVAGGHVAGYTNQQLNYPIGLSYDAFSKSSIIANYFAHNIVQWTLGASNWTLIAGGLNGTYGNTSTLLYQPRGVTMDPMSNVYVADNGNYRIQFFLQGQSEGATIAGVTGVAGVNATLFISPSWVQLDNQLNLSAVLRWNSSGITVASSLVSSYGFKVDRFDTLYVAEFNAHRIRKWLSGAPNGTIIAGSVNGTNGSASNQFYYPVDVLVEDNGDMYVTDRGNGRLQFRANGSSSGITVAGTGSNNSMHLSGPSGIVQDSSSKEIYIADSGQSAVVNYPSGSIVAGGHGAGYTNQQLSGPTGLSYDAFSKSSIISNYGAHNIVQWTLGASNWTLIAGGLNGTYGNTSTLLYHPLGVTTDPMGNVYVADAVNCRIQFFLQGQSEGATIAGVTGVAGANATLLSSPHWVQLDNQLNLYVADTDNGRIQKFFRY